MLIDSAYVLRWGNPKSYITQIMRTERGVKLFFIALAKMRGEVTPEFREMNQKALKNLPPGMKIHNVFWTLGQYDFVIFYEAPSEKEAIKMGAAWAKFCETQTLTAIPQEEAQKLFK